MNSTSRKLRSHSLPVEDLYASSGGEIGLGEGGVISLLNMEGKPGAKRVAELVEAFRRASQLMESIKASGDKQYVVLGSAVTEINDHLSKFQWRPAFFGFTGAESYIKVRYLMVVGMGDDAMLAFEQYAI